MQGGAFGHVCVQNLLEYVPVLENLVKGNTREKLQITPIYPSCQPAFVVDILEQESIRNLILSEQLPLFPNLKSIFSITINMHLAPVLIRDVQLRWAGNWMFSPYV